MDNKKFIEIDRDAIKLQNQMLLSERDTLQRELDKIRSAAGDLNISKNSINESIMKELKTTKSRKEELQKELLRTKENLYKGSINDFSKTNLVDSLTYLTSVADKKEENSNFGQTNTYTEIDMNVNTNINTSPVKQESPMSPFSKKDRSSITNALNKQDSIDNNKPEFAITPQLNESIPVDYNMNETIQTNRIATFTDIESPTTGGMLSP